MYHDGLFFPPSSFVRRRRAARARGAPPPSSRASTRRGTSGAGGSGSAALRGGSPLAQIVGPLHLTPALSRLSPAACHLPPSSVRRPHRKRPSPPLQLSQREMSSKRQRHNEAMAAAGSGDAPSAKRAPRRRRGKRPSLRGLGVIPSKESAGRAVDTSQVSPDPSSPPPAMISTSKLAQREPAAEKACARTAASEAMGREREWLEANYLELRKLLSRQRETEAEVAEQLAAVAAARVCRNERRCAGRAAAGRAVLCGGQKFAHDFVPARRRRPGPLPTPPSHANASLATRLASASTPACTAASEQSRLVINCCRFQPNSRSSFPFSTANHRPEQPRPCLAANLSLPTPANVILRPSINLLVARPASLCRSDELL